MKANGTIVVIAVIFAALMAACKFERASLWDMKCAACHDGKTVLNEKVMPGKQELRIRYSNMDEFSSSCQKAPRCMNILKHDEELFIDVGRELGIPEKLK